MFIATSGEHDHERDLLRHCRDRMSVKLGTYAKVSYEFRHSVIGKRFLTMGHFQLFSMILKFSMGHFLSLYTDFDGPFFKLMGLWRMAPCLPNHWTLSREM